MVGFYFSGDGWQARYYKRLESRGPFMELFPLFLKLQGRSCLVVGAGKIAEGKIESLVRCGASVRVVAPTATVGVRKVANDGQIVWEQRTFSPADLAGVFLVIAATPFPDLHEQIFQQARREESYAMPWMSRSAVTFIIRQCCAAAPCRLPSPQEGARP